MNKRKLLTLCERVIEETQAALWWQILSDELRHFNELTKGAIVVSWEPTPTEGFERASVILHGPAGELSCFGVATYFVKPAEQGIELIRSNFMAGGKPPSGFTTGNKTRILVECEYNKRNARQIKRIVEDWRDELLGLLESEKPNSQTAAGKTLSRGKARQVRRPSANLRMLEKIQKDKKSHGWTCTQWAQYLKVSTAAVVKTPSWGKLKEIRLKQDADRRLKKSMVRRKG